MQVPTTQYVAFRTRIALKVRGAAVAAAWWRLGRGRCGGMAVAVLAATVAMAVTVALAVAATVVAALAVVAVVLLALVVAMAIRLYDDHILSRF